MKHNNQQLLEILTLAATGQTPTAIAKAMGLGVNAVNGRLARARRGGVTIESLRAEMEAEDGGNRQGVKITRPTNSAPPAGLIQPTTGKAKGHTLDEFRAKFDVGKVIADKCAELLGEDGEEWFHDSDFRTLCGVPIQHWRRNADEFPQYQFKKGKFHAWAPVHMVEQFQHLTGHVG